MSSAPVLLCRVYAMELLAAPTTHRYTLLFPVGLLFQSRCLAVAMVELTCPTRSLYTMIHRLFTCMLPTAENYALLCIKNMLRAFTLLAAGGTYRLGN